MKNSLNSWGVGVIGIRDNKRGARMPPIRPRLIFSFSSFTVFTPHP